MEQHSARTGPKSGAAPNGRPPANRPVTAEGPTPGEHPAVRPAPPRTGVSSLLPRAVALIRTARPPRIRPRLTGLGTGLLTSVGALLGGIVDATLFDGPGVFFGLVFVAVSAAAALCVRPQDLVAAPVSAPIAFALAVALIGDGSGSGLTGHLIGLFTGLALMTAWLYTGTVVAAGIVGIRALLRSSRRRRSPRCSGERRERSPRDRS